MSVRRPRLVAVVQHAPDAGEYERSKARVDLALHARQQGYEPVEVFELEGDRGRDDATLEELATTATGGDIDAILLSPTVDPTAVADLAGRAGLDVITAPERAPGS